ncbi:extracellular solute-binding protein [Gryllotalpicola reticulitermitis]|uniref:Extracellular solute-binding protein n=1 Tax=Gryllotalpicola reticulitermitis TaxID=1184153 RepID=A0ABV8Q1X1_9MICO
MRKTRIMAFAALGVATALALTACGGSNSAGGSDSSFSTSGKGKTLVVWNMTGDLTDATMKAINDEFTKETGAKVKVETQQWDNIATKVTTALATSTPPDVIELGNTDVPSFAASGGLLDLTADKSKLQQGGTWLAGLEGPATVDGKLYGVPAFAATRVVIYNKQMWNEAGVTAAPTTYADLTADLDKVKAKFGTTSDFSPFYLPGKYWYAGLQWVWDAGGDVATGSGTSWKGGLESPQSITGLTAFKNFQNTYSTKASATVDTDGTGNPDQDKDIFAQNKTSAILGNSWEIGAITQDNPKITASDLGTFPFPGVSGKNQPVMLAGSDWGIAAKSKNAGLAKTWVKIAASTSIQQNQIVGQGWIPVTTQLASAAASSASDINKAFFTAAQNSKSTPAAAKWSTIEGDGAVQQFFSDIASGAKTPAQSAKTFDDHLNSVLNGQ